MMANNYIEGLREGAVIEAAEMNLVSLLKPRLSIDGDQYCWLLGEDLMNGVAGFGRSAYEAALDFNRAFKAQIPTPRPGASS